MLVFIIYREQEDCATRALSHIVEPTYRSSRSREVKSLPFGLIVDRDIYHVAKAQEITKCAGPHASAV